MPQAQTTKGKGKGRKVGRNLEKCKRYRAAHTRERNKIGKILQSNGYDYAIIWSKSAGYIIPDRLVNKYFSVRNNKKGKQIHEPKLFPSV